MRILFFLLFLLSQLISSFHFNKNIDLSLRKELILKAKLCKICYCKNHTFNIKRNKMLNIYDNYTYLNDTNNKSFCYIFYNKNKIDICFKGTSNINDFYSNLQICPSNYFNNTNIQIHNGFLSKYLSLKNSILSIINTIGINNDSKQIEISFNGHSSGGGIATIAALDFSYIYDNYNIKCYTFGAPIIGNSYFINEFNKRINKNRNNSYRIINEYDIIPYLNLYENTDINDMNIKLNSNNNDNKSYHEQEIKLKNVKKTPLIKIIKNIYEYLKTIHGITRYIKNLND